MFNECWKSNKFQVSIMELQCFVWLLDCCSTDALFSSHRPRPPSPQSLSKTKMDIAGTQRRVHIADCLIVCTLSHSLLYWRVSFYIGVSILNLRLDYIHLVAGNLSRCFLLATNLSPPTSRITHFPSPLSSSWSPRSADTFISFIKFLTPSFILQNEIEIKYQT